MQKLEVEAVEEFIEQTNREVVVIIEACESGSFVDNFESSKYSNNIRVVASSSAPSPEEDAPSYILQMVDFLSLNLF